MFVKICGITRLEDAQNAVASGADALGFVCWPRSPRYVTPERIRSIVSALPAGIITVGVFVNQAADEINRVLRETALRVAQLHGDEQVAMLDTVSRPLLKAIPVGKGAPAAEIAAWPRRVTLLLDAHDPDRRGGTGRTANWEQAARVACSRRVVLAGGLHAGNVAEAVHQVRPYGVDVSSGVEQAPGVKDPQRLRDLFGALNELAWERSLRAGEQS
jgi:phosphoribosylanthranilate isomerase